MTCTEGASSESTRSDVQRLLKKGQVAFDQAGLTLTARARVARIRQLAAHNNCRGNPMSDSSRVDATVRVMNRRALEILRLAATESTTISQLSVKMGIRRRIVVEICQDLEASGVLVDEGGSFRTSMQQLVAIMPYS